MVVLSPGQPFRSNDSRSVSRRRSAILTTLCIVLAILFGYYYLRAFLPLMTSAWQSSSPNFRACNGNAACCERLFSPPSRPHKVVNTLFRLSRSGGGEVRRWRMATHPNSDIVSQSIQRYGNWDLGKSWELLRAIRVPAKNGILLDIGANIGWFTLAMAHAGHRVVAIEPFVENLALLRHSLCLASPEVRDRIQLIPYALGTVDGMRCELWQNATFNRGDTFTVCSGSATAPEADRMRRQGFLKLGEAVLRRLDTIITTGMARFPKDTGVIVKIDVEGFEPIAFQGAKEFLAQYRPILIYAEYIPKMIEAAAQSIGVSVAESKKRPEMFLKFMANAGYSHALYGYKMQKNWGPTYEAKFTRRTS